MENRIYEQKSQIYYVTLFFKWNSHKNRSRSFNFETLR